MALPSPQNLTPQEYLAAERKAEFRSEFVDGEVFAMAGAKESHTQICVNLLTSLTNRFKGTDCRALGMDLRISVPNTRLFTYPDAFIVCGKTEHLDEREDTLLNPIVIFEVLSPSTEAWDRGEKFARYQTIASLREYVLISQSQTRIERFVLHDGAWAYHVYEGSEASLKLESVDVQLPLTEIFDRVEFTPASRPTGEVR